MKDQTLSLSSFFQDLDNAIAPEILSYLRWESILGLCCVSTIYSRAAYHCPRVEINPSEIQTFNLARKSAHYLKVLLIGSDNNPSKINVNQRISDPATEQTLISIFSALRSGIWHGIEELTIHVSLKAPWSNIARSLLHDSVKLGSLSRLRRFDYHIDGSSKDDFIADICKHCPQLQELHLPPPIVWQGNPHAQLDALAVIRQPCWPVLRRLTLDPFIPIFQHGANDAEQLAKAFDRTRFPSLTGLNVTMKGLANADHVIWSVLLNPSATVIPYLRELRIATLPPTGLLWSRDSYQHFGNPHSTSVVSIANLSAVAEGQVKQLIDRLRQCMKDGRLKSLQILHISDGFFRTISGDLTNALSKLSLSINEENQHDQYIANTGF